MNITEQQADGLRFAISALFIVMSAVMFAFGLIIGYALAEPPSGPSEGIAGYRCEVMK